MWCLWTARMETYRFASALSLLDPNGIGRWGDMALAFRVAVDLGRRLERRQRRLAGVLLLGNDGGEFVIRHAALSRRESAGARTTG